MNKAYSVDNTTFSPIVVGNQSRSQNVFGGSDKFFNTLNNTMAVGSQIAGPWISAASPGIGAQSVNAAISTFGGYSRGQMNPTNGQAYSMSKGQVEAPPYYQPGSDAYNSQGGAGTFDEQINAMGGKQMEYLAMQTRVQDLSMTTNTLSNIMKAENDAKANTVRNFRP